MKRSDTKRGRPDVSATLVNAPGYLAMTAVALTCLAALSRASIMVAGAPLVSVSLSGALRAPLRGLTGAELALDAVLSTEGRGHDG
jgi:hypothetical protein